MEELVDLWICEAGIGPKIGANNPDSATLAFHAALAEQCFINNYVFAAAPGEIVCAEKLKASLAAIISAGEPVSPMLLVAVACYGPLHTLPGVESLLESLWPETINSLLNRQVRLPLEERRIAATIPALTTVDDSVSRSVREQYEESPYPVWVATAQAVKAMPIDADLRRRFPFAPTRPRVQSGRTEILIAGCGTGQQSAEVARRYENVSVLAVDLSIASLRYAKRQTMAQGLTNVEYAQADILRLGSIGRTFDVIAAGGVLHHMADPAAALRTLAALLRPGGFMSLGFYSELGRRNIVAAQRYAVERGIRATAEDIRRFRQEIMNLEGESPVKSIVGMADFYSLNECRDLVFHAQEHRMLLPQIKAMLLELGLEFLGFDIDLHIRQRYAASFPDDRAMTNLDCWHDYETRNPETFIGMYQFWVQRLA